MFVLVNYRTIDSLAVAYGKGKLTCFLGDLNAIVDVVRFYMKPIVFIPNCYLSREFYLRIYQENFSTN